MITCPTFESQVAGLTWNKLKVEANAYFTETISIKTTCIVVALYGRGILTRSISKSLECEIFLPITTHSYDPPFIPLRGI